MECKNNPQVERLLWRVIKGAIPVSSNLERRGLPRFNCKACGAHEDDLHVFLNCPIAVEVWNQIPLAHKPLTSIPSLAMLIKQGKDYVPLPPTGLNAPLWPWVVWNLWKARNKLVFENRAFTAQEIVLKSIKDAKEWNDAQSVQKATTVNNFSPFRPPVCSSCPPPPSTFRQIYLFAMLMQRGTQCLELVALVEFTLVTMFETFPTFLRLIAMSLQL